MRGPLLAGPAGHPAVLRQIVALCKPHAPTVVLSSVWLAVTLSRALPVILCAEPDKRAAARRALRRRKPDARGLLALVAGEGLPIGAGRVGSLIVDGLADVERDTEAIGFLADLAALLRPGGPLISVDLVRAAAATRLGGCFLAASLQDLHQARPRRRVLLTWGRAPSAIVTAARHAAARAIE